MKISNKNLQKQAQLRQKKAVNLFFYGLVTAYFVQHQKISENLTDINKLNLSKTFQGH